MEIELQSRGSLSGFRTYGPVIFDGNVDCSRELLNLLKSKEDCFDLL